MNNRTTILPCPSCRRRLRVPTDRGELLLTCPACRTRWYWSPRREDVRFTDDDVLFIGDEYPPGEPVSPGGGRSTSDLWDDALDGLRTRGRPGTVILPCRNCQRILQVPTNLGELVLTCPICRTRWDWSPSVDREAPGRNWVRWARQVLLRSRA
jgi:uncharacterized protein YbaR (Trm112 family)